MRDNIGKNLLRSILKELWPFIIVMALISGCKEKATLLESSWGHPNMANYQSFLDRSRAMTYLENEKINIALENNSDSLYIALRTSDREIKSRITHGGLTLWFDGQGMQRKILGIHYPLGMPMPMERPLPKKNTKKEKSPAPDSAAAPDTNLAKAELKAKMDSVEIIASNPDQRRIFPKSNLPGISADFMDTLGVLLYRITLPLKISGDSAYAIGAEPGSTISLGFESGPIVYKSSKSDSVENVGPPDQRRGWNEPGPGGYGSEMPPPPRNRQILSGSQEFWVKAMLAKQPSGK